MAQILVRATVTTDGYCAGWTGYVDDTDPAVQELVAGGYLTTNVIVLPPPVELCCLPPGGTTNQILAKVSNLDRDAAWLSAPPSLPSGPASGVLSGTYPNPIFAEDMATQAELNAAIAAIPGGGAPTGAAGGAILSGTYPNPGIKTGTVSWPTDGKLILTDNLNTGSVSRMITLRSTNAIDRPWISWVDENARHVVATGYHTQLPASEGGNILKQFEVKTVADAVGPLPGELRTRFAIQCDVQRGTWGVNFIDNFEINQGENPIITTPGSVTNFGLRLRTAPQDVTAAAAANFVAAQFVAQIDAADNVSGFLDVNVPYRSGGTLFPGNKSATLNIFRNTNTLSSSSPAIAIKKGDGTNTNSAVFTAPSGKLQLLLATAAAGSLELGNDVVANLYRSAAGTLKTDGGFAVTGVLTAASPVFTGNPTAPTPAAADNDTSVATTAFVQGEIAAKAPLASPVFTGNPTAPTPTAGDNDTSIATTAFVTTAVAGGGGGGFVYATAAPTTGAHTVHELVWNTTPEPGGNIGWVCTTAGTPGTWKPWGVIGV